MGKIAIISPAQIKPKALISRLSFLVPGGKVVQASHLSNLGINFNLDDTAIESAHLYTPLNNSYDKIIVVNEFPVLYANDFTVCWLGFLLLDCSENAELFIEVANEKSNKLRNRLTLDYLKEKLPRANIKKVHKTWIRVSKSQELSIKINALPTIYKYFHNSFPDFFAVRNNESYGDKENEAQIEADALRSFIYSLFGANQKSFVLEQIIAENFPYQKICGCDLGGGYGFMAAELAIKGHTMSVIDYNQSHVEIGRWLAKRCHLGKNFTISQGKIEDISRMDSTFDMISYFGCLLYVKRQYIPDVFQASMKRLRPGGVLVVHENPKEAGKPGSLDYEERFFADELLNLFRDNAGEAKLYNMFSGMMVELETTKNKLIMAAIRK